MNSSKKRYVELGLECEVTPYIRVKMDDTKSER